METLRNDPVRDTLMDLYKENGKLTAQIVVDSARSPESPLHDRFEWDDSKAAEAYRREQARGLIRQVKIERVDSDGQPTGEQIRAFVNPVPVKITKASMSKERSYVPTVVAFENHELAETLLWQMERDWITFKTKYERFAEFADFIRGEVDELEAKEVDA